MFIMWEAHLEFFDRNLLWISGTIVSVKLRLTDGAFWVLVLIVISTL